MNILEITDLSVKYLRNKTVIPAVRGVSFAIGKNETIGIVGESGCGKTSVALALLGLIFPEEGKIEGIVSLEGTDIVKIPFKKCSYFRGKDIAIVFQDPFASLNPVITVGKQIGEALSVHDTEITKKEESEKVHKTLKEVSFEDTERIYHSYPHQLSGGQRQRAAIAMAIINRPKILVLDEPTTALDVTIQKEIMDLIDRLKNELNLSVILITHNLALANERCQRTAVMYAGKIVEFASTKDIFHFPHHPYTKALVDALPHYDKKHGNVLQGQPPDPTKLPAGCPFAPRCAKVMDKCRKSDPADYKTKDRIVRCYLYKKYDG